jgi:signal transduction histidine kinase
VAGAAGPARGYVRIMGVEAAPGDEVFERLSEVVLAVTSQLSVRDVLQMIVRSARSLAGARYAALGVPDDRGGFAEFVVDGISARQQARIGPLPRQHGMLAVILREGKPLRLDDITADPRFGGWWPAAHPDLSDVLGVPILGASPEGSPDARPEGSQDASQDASPEGPQNDSRVLGFIFAASKRDGFTGRDERLLTLFAAHAAIALTNARLYERGRELSVLEERARLARDLHDAVSQKLFSVRAKARAAALLVGRDPARAAAEIDSVADLAGQAHAELRAVIDGLAPPDLAADGLLASIRSYAVLVGRTYGSEVLVQADELPPLDRSVQTVLYRVAQEAISNALRHSGSAEVCVTVRRRARSVQLEVADHGSGFDPASPRSGLGLNSMRERAGAVAGRLSVTSRPNAGTTVRLTVPLTVPLPPGGAGP